MFFTKILNAIYSTRYLTTGIFILSLNMMPAAFAADTTRVGQYLSVKNEALPMQQDLLTQTFQVKFPTTVKTVREAMQYILRFSGYALANEPQLGTQAKVMLALPLPVAHRALGPITLQDGLITLAGNTFTLLADPVHRLISFRLKPSLQSLYPNPTL